MDELQDYELQLLIENICWSYKNEWEMSRLISYCAVAPYMKNKKDIDKMFPLPTDNDNKYNLGGSLSQEEADKITSMMEKYNSKLKNGNTNNSKSKR